MDTPNTFQAVLRQALRFYAFRLDATDQYPSVWAAVLGGAGLGAVWGIAARIWMRLISTNPEFTIAGTVGILIITTIFGACAGFAFTARRRGWRGWGHYLPRSLAVIFFIPFGIAGGLPLMLTVLVATLGITRRAVVGLWVVAGLVALVAVGTDIVIPTMVAVSAPAGALALTAWKWSIRRWHGHPGLLTVDIWLERIGRGVLLLLAAFGFGFVSWGIVSDKPGWFAPVYILYYLILLYPLFLALRVGLEPGATAGPREAIQSNPAPDSPG